MQTFDVQLTAATIPIGRVTLHGSLHVPEEARGVVLFAHGAGGSQHNPRNRRVAEYLREAGFATLLFDMLAAEERAEGRINRRVRFDVELLANRVKAATQWVQRQPETTDLPVGYFGAGTGGAAAMLAAAENRDVRALVTRGARTDLASRALARLTTPTRLIVGGNDTAIVPLNLETWAQLTGEKSIETVPGASHRFDEPGALDNVAALAASWFLDHLRRETSS